MKWTTQTRTTRLPEHVTAAQILFTMNANSAVNSLNAIPKRFINLQDKMAESDSKSVSDQIQEYINMTSGLHCETSDVYDFESRENLVVLLIYNETGGSVGIYVHSDDDLSMGWWDLSFNLRNPRLMSTMDLATSQESDGVIFFKADGEYIQYITLNGGSDMEH